MILIYFFLILIWSSNSQAYYKFPEVTLDLSLNNLHYWSLIDDSFYKIKIRCVMFPELTPCKRVPKFAICEETKCRVETLPNIRVYLFETAIHSENNYHTYYIDIALSRELGSTPCQAIHDFSSEMMWFGDCIIFGLLLSAAVSFFNLSSRIIFLSVFFYLSYWLPKSILSYECKWTPHIIIDLI